ncbi:PH domain-containing protein [Actinosynnema sp. CA-248983]
MFGWILMAGVLAVGSYALLDPFPGSTFVDAFGVIAVTAPLIWMGWMVTVHPVVKIYEAGVLVVNWFRRYWVPWAELASVESTDEVNLVLASGERIGVASGAFSMASSLRGNRLQDRLRDGIEHHRPDPVPAASGGVVRSLDLCPWHFLALVGYLLVVAWFGVHPPS